MSTPRKYAEATGCEAVFIETRFPLTPGKDENGIAGLSDETMGALADLVWKAAQPAIQAAIDDGSLPIEEARGGYINAAFPSDKAVAARKKRTAERVAKEAQAQQAATNA